jgi:hypothetical protein
MKIFGLGLKKQRLTIGGSGENPVAAMKFWWVMTCRRSVRHPTQLENGWAERSKAVAIPFSFWVTLSQF